MEQLIFNTWKVGEVIEFPDVEVKYRCGDWIAALDYDINSFNNKSRQLIKPVLYKGEEHLCFETMGDSYFMIPKSELIRIGMLKEEKVFGNTFNESRNKALNQAYHPIKETKEEMKAITFLTFEHAKEIYGYAATSINIKLILEAQFPELKPKLITELVKTVEDAHKYVLKENIPYHNNLYYTYQDGVSNNSHAGILRLAHVLNEEWIADWEDDKQKKWYARYNSYKGYFEFDFNTTVSNGSIYFKDEFTITHAYKHNQQLFNDLFKVK